MDNNQELNNPQFDRETNAEYNNLMSRWGSSIGRLDSAEAKEIRNEIQTYVEVRNNQRKKELNKMDTQTEEEARQQFNGQALDPEAREREALRNRASLGKMLSDALHGRRYSGIEEEYRQSVKAEEREIPLDIFETRADVVTNAPSTIGINMSGMVPNVFNRSIASQIGIEMPQAPSGQYSIPKLNKSLDGVGLPGKGAKQESTAATFTVVSTKPHRITARMSLTLEDLAEAGIPGFEGSLRQNLSLVLSEALDNQILTGDGTGNNISGLMKQLTADTDPTKAITFSDFVSDIAGYIDGLFATELSDLKLVTNPAIYQKLLATFQTPVLVGATSGSGGGTPSIMSAINWAKQELSGAMTHGRMPASASNIGKCLVVRGGRMTEPTPMAGACIPIWGNLSISDPYTDSGSGLEHFTMHTLIGDVLVKHAEIYSELRIKTA